MDCPTNYRGTRPRSSIRNLCPGYPQTSRLNRQRSWQRHYPRGVPRSPRPTLPTLSLPDSLHSLLPRDHTWSVYTDASWRAKQPLHPQAVFGTQGTQEGRGALFLSADSPDWCSHIAAIRFEIPPTLRALDGTAQVAELLAIYTGLFLLYTLNLRGTIYSDCLAAVKKITRTP